jgi:hypothetical protein
MIVHQYDFDRTCMDGPRVKCGRYARNVKWTAGYTDNGKKVAITCKSCLKKIKNSINLS